MLAAAALAALPLFVSGYSTGPPVRRTGAPGDRVCLDAGCHVGVRLDSSTAIELETPTRGAYIPGGLPQQWRVRILDARARVHGLQLSVRAAIDPARQPAGRLRALQESTVVICEDERPPDPLNGCPDHSPVQFFHHTAPRTVGEFLLEWTPPATDIGDVSVYAVANASVTGQRNARIHFQTFRLQPSSSALSRAILIDAASGLERFSSGSWISLFGTGLAPTVRMLAGFDIVNGVLPTRLDGVEVRINGRAAAISYVSPSQVNAQAPADEATGQIGIEVLYEGRRTAAGSAWKQVVAPSLFEHRVGGAQFVLAQRPDGYAGPIAPGGRAILYGTGFGATNPLVPPGRVVGSAAPLSSAVRVEVDRQPAVVEFASLVGAGLYQFNIVVPTLPPGDYSVTVSTSTEATQPGLSIRIGQ
jgi:uncharacterized protein (TIGR03437 family)